MLCPNCKRPTTRTNDFCPHCGAFVPRNASTTLKREDFSGEPGGLKGRINDVSGKARKYSASSEDKIKALLQGGTRPTTPQEPEYRKSKRTVSPQPQRPVYPAQQAQRPSTSVQQPQKTSTPYSNTYRPSTSAGTSGQSGTGGNATVRTNVPSGRFTPQKIFLFVILAMLFLPMLLSALLSIADLSPEPDIIYTEQTVSEYYFSDYTVTDVVIDTDNSTILSLRLSFGSPVTDSNGEIYSELPFISIMGDVHFFVYGEDGIDYTAPADFIGNDIVVNKALLPVGKAIGILYIASFDDKTLLPDDYSMGNSFTVLEDGSVEQSSDSLV